MVWRRPASWLFGGLSALRRLAYQQHVLPEVSLPVPVVVVGNILAGGSGKTPVVLALAQSLGERGFCPGIISRGYRGRLSRSGGVHHVTREARASDVGDEPLLLARHSGCPVVIGADRVAAGLALLAAHPECDIVLSDDGLQHYRLMRDVNIIVVDARCASERYLLPAGLLRERQSRLALADALVMHADVHLPSAWCGDAHLFSLSVVPGNFYRLGDSDTQCCAADFQGRRCHAVAGLGVPERFFTQLARMGLDCIHHPFPDHHRYVSDDLDFEDGDILTTEKDAVKLEGLTHRPIWVLPITAHIAPDLAGLIIEKLEKKHGRSPA